jgi:hypothetical protein
VGQPGGGCARVRRLAGSTGQTYNITEVLDELRGQRLGLLEDKDYVRSSGSMSGKGLFRTFEKTRNGLHLLEDMENIANDRAAQNVLRAALWAPPKKDRVVTWTTEGHPNEGTWRGPQQVTFTGGLIMTGNIPLADLPVLRALGSRILLCTLDPTDEQLFAHMRRIAKKGWEHGHRTLPADRCLAVTDYIAQRCRETGLSPDLRLQWKACSQCAYAQTCPQARQEWKKLVDRQVAEFAQHFGQSARHATRLENREGMLAAVRRVWQEAQSYKDRLALWTELTGEGKTAMYEWKDKAGLD